MKARAPTQVAAPAGGSASATLPLLPAPRSKRFLAKEVAREKFRLAYVANPLNFLPGSIVHYITKHYPPKRWEIEGKRILEARRRNAQ